MTFGTRNLARAMALAASGLLVGASGARAADPVPAEFQGDWVPASATCSSPMRFQVTEDRMTLVNGKDSQSYGGIGIALSYFGPDYQGIQVVAMPELDSMNSPFNVTFNAGEKKGVTQIDIYSEIKGTTNQQVLEIQAAAKKLAQRFPLDHMPLKKCPASEG